MGNKIKVSAKGKSGSAELMEIHVSKLVPAGWNPNELTEDKFNALFDNMSDAGVLETFTVTPIEGTDTYMVVGGHHRLEVAKMLGYEMVPCLVKHGMSDMDVKFQNMRLNVIRGKINPEKFTKLYEELQSQHPEKDIALEMGITSPDELNRLILSTKKQLPTELQDAFAEASKEIKTVDQLVNVLNELFTKHGKDLGVYNYMVLDYEGAKALWVRMLKKDFEQVKELTKLCLLQSVAFDAIVRKLIGDLLSMPEEGRQEFFNGLEKVSIPELGNNVPTEDAIDNAQG